MKLISLQPLILLIPTIAYASAFNARFRQTKPEKAKAGISIPQINNEEKCRSSVSALYLNLLNEINEAKKQIQYFASRERQLQVSLADLKKNLSPANSKEYNFENEQKREFGSSKIDRVQTEIKNLQNLYQNHYENSILLDKKEKNLKRKIQNVFLIKSLQSPRPIYADTLQLVFKNKCDTIRYPCIRSKKELSLLKDIYRPKPIPKPCQLLIEEIEERRNYKSE